MNSEKTSISRTNDRIVTCGIIGIGRVAVKHLKALKNFPQYKLTVVISNNLNTAKDTVKKILKPTYIENIQFCLSPNEIKAWPEVMAIATPSGTHFALARQALENNCDLILEKPMTLQLDECRDLLELAKTKNKTIIMGHIYRYFPFISSIQKNIQLNKYGRLLHCNINTSWGHDDLYYSRQKWRGTWANDGGALMNQTIHAVDLLLWLSNSQVDSLNCYTGNYTHFDIEAEDSASVNGRLINGATFSIFGSTATDPARHSAAINLIFQNGKIDLGIKNNLPYIKIEGSPGFKSYLFPLLKTLLRPDDQLFFNRLSPGQRLNIYTNPHTGIYWEMLKLHLYREQPRLSDNVDGLRAVEVIIAAYLSCKKQKAVNLPLAIEKYDYSHQPFRTKT